MAYLGRVVGVGLTKNERPCGIYAVSGRSEGSRMRIAEIAEGEFPSVKIGPYGELSPQQEAQRDLLFYNAIKINNGKRRAVISNGKQTDPIELMLQEIEKEERELDFPLAIAHGFVDQKGAEPDKFRTPRIAGIIDEEGRAALGIVTNYGLNTVNAGSRKISYVSTYAANPLNKSEIIIPDRLDIPFGHIISKSISNPQELADDIYDLIDQNFVVCSAAAVWNPDTQRWDLAVRNLHNR